MKKILFALTALFSANALSAQPPLTTPVVVEDYYPFTTFGGELDSGHPLGHMNAYSRGDVSINGTQSDLYTYTWDDGDKNFWNGAIGIGGFAVRQYATGVPVNSTSTSLLDDAVILGPLGSNICHSVESGIMMENGIAYIMVTYIKATSTTSSLGEYMVDLYEWTTGGLVQVSGYPFAFATSLTGGINGGWIHQDVNQDNKAVVTYEFDGKIYAMAVEMASGSLNLYNSYDLDEGTINGFELQNPDVALQYFSPDNTWGVYYTFTDVDNNNLFVVKGTWDDLVAGGGFALGTYAGSVPVELLDMRTTAGAYDLPRIDANDVANSDDERLWSCVVGDGDGIQNFIFTTYGNFLGSTNNYVLNDGSLGTFDISYPFLLTTTNYYNRRPVVAFSQNKQEMYYGWCYRDDGIVWALPSANYISLKLRVNGNVLNTFAGGLYEYARIQDNISIPLGNGYYKRAMAFSPENATSPQLFTAFFQTDPNNELNYFIAQKTTDWITASFRPAAQEESENAMTNIAVFPNPTHDYFVLQSKSLETFDLKIVDITGKLRETTKGSIDQLNACLKNVKLPTGNYLIQLTDNAGKTISLKVVKQ